MSRKELDWTKTGTVNAMAEWLRSKSDALLVFVVRRDDAVLVADKDVMPRDAQNLVELHIGDEAVALDRARRGLQKDARLEFGPLPE